jgi:formylglycine-generating enzyme required for sulfatase activity
MYRIIQKHVVGMVLVLSLTLPSFSACPSADLTGDCRVDLEDFAILAAQWLTEGLPEPQGIVWVDINDPGVSGHEGFSGQMSRHETTNAQYCQFLNAAKASGDIIIRDDNFVSGASGSNSGVDFVNQAYYNLDGEGYTDDGASNGGAARIHFIGSKFKVDSGFEDHPVTFVSWYGATAFASYYGWRLPTEWEWQAVADYNGSFIYGCGTTINNNMANYLGSIHPDGTTVVGVFGTYGYGMCDMAGNVWEWTSSLWDPESDLRILRGGGWFNDSNTCKIVSRDYYNPYDAGNGHGFRVCR